MENSFRFYQNKACAFFPCHKVEDESTFNCMFCYCPLYALGDKCGGNCTYIADEVKDCSACRIPHSPNGYDYINSKFEALAALAKENRSK